MKKVVIAPQERIDDFERTAVEFFRAVLGMDYGECIVTDESRLSDFASCGLPEDIAWLAMMVASVASTTMGMSNSRGTMP